MIPRNLIRSLRYCLNVLSTAIATYIVTVNRFWYWSRFTNLLQLTCIRPFCQAVFLMIFLVSYSWNRVKNRIKIQLRGGVYEKNLTAPAEFSYCIGCVGVQKTAQNETTINRSKEICQIDIWTAFLNILDQLKQWYYCLFQKNSIPLNPYMGSA